VPMQQTVGVTEKAGMAVIGRLGIHVKDSTESGMKRKRIKTN
jgi:hypothetical protein